MAKRTERYSCGNCDFVTQDPNDLNDVQHIQYRVAPGDTQPDGECPRCGCMVFLDGPDEPRALVKELKALFLESLSAWQDEEDSVKREHRDLIGRMTVMADRTRTL